MVTVTGDVAWRYSTEVPLIVQPAYRADRNEIAVVGLDLTFQRLSAATGELLWRSRKVGRSSFGDVKPYANGYLVVVDEGMYREDARPGEPIPPDSLEYYGETDRDSWRVDFPVGARLTVAGNVIYAVSYGRNSVTLQEIAPPTQKK
jgi:hypothetical protein